MLIATTLLMQIVTQPPRLALPVRRTRAIAAVYRLWDPDSGAPLHLATWSVAVDGIRRRIDSLPLTIRYRFEPRDGRRQEVTASEVASFSRTHLAGVSVVPAPAGEGEWSLRVQVPAPSQGTEFRGTTGAAPLEPFALSDIVVGDSTQQLAVRVGRHDVILAPRQVIARDVPLELYFQVRSPVAADSARFTYRLRRVVGGEPVPEETLRVTMVGALQTGITPVQQRLGADRLIGDHFLLEVRVEVDEARSALQRTELHLIRAGP